MAIALAGTTSKGASATVVASFVPTMASTTAGHVCLLHVVSAVASTVSISAGWTEELELDGGASSIEVYRRVLTGGDAAPTVTFSVAESRYGYIMTAWSGVDNTTPIDIKGSNTGSSPASGNCIAPSVTTTVANTRLVCGFTCDSSGTWTPPSGMSEEEEQTGASNCTLEVASVAVAGIGATGTKTAVNSNTNIEWATSSIALNPEAAGGRIMSSMVNSGGLAGSGGIAGVGGGLAG